MNTPLPGLCVAVATILTSVACQDASTAPRAAARSPTFAATSDTGGGGGGGAVQFHFVANGDVAYVNWFNADSGGGGGGFSYTAGYLNVGRGGPTNRPQTFLDYYVYQFVCDPYFNCSFNLLAAGYGLIPNRDLSGGGGQLRLNTNTANDPSFFVYAGPAGIVSVSWNSNGLSQNSSSGTSSYRFGNFTQRNQGSSTNWSANATGNVVGLPILSFPNAQIGTNHSVTIDIYR